MNAARRVLPVDDAPLLEAERLALKVGERCGRDQHALVVAERQPHQVRHDQTYETNRTDQRHRGRRQ